MPSLLGKLRRRRDNADASGATPRVVESAAREKSPVPEFKFFRQSTQDPEPLQIDIPTRELSSLHVSGDQPQHASGVDQDEPRTPTLQVTNPLNASVAASGSSQSPPRSGEKRMSRRLLSSLTRRPSMMSHRSRASSHVPDFEPIDHSTDVESQWEQRAMLLARAGPPSPAIPRSDSIYDMGPPRLPPVVFDSSLQSPEKSPGDRSVSAPERMQDGGFVAQIAPPRIASYHNSRAPNLSSASSNLSLAHHAHEEETKDDLLQLAVNEHEKGDYTAATQLYKKAAVGEDGLPLAQIMYGLSLRHGWGVEKDEARSVHWLRLAASSSAAVEEMALATGTLGGGHMKGDLVLAIFELGNSFRYGWGVEVDKVLARHYYETAANLKDADAMFEVAWCYETGFGTKKDKYKAAYWYRKQSEQTGVKIAGMQWIWKPKYEHDPFVATPEQNKKMEKKA